MGDPDGRVRASPLQRRSTASSLRSVGTGPLHESFPYVTFDRSGRFLLGASYGAHLVSVNPVGADGRVGEPMQVIPTARNAHAIITDNTNQADREVPDRHGLELGGDRQLRLV